MMVQFYGDKQSLMGSWKYSARHARTNILPTFKHENSDKNATHPRRLAWISVIMVTWYTR